MSKAPDFMIIGAMKCATSTLHEQLARVPGIFMTTPKEPNFFSDDEQFSKGKEWYESLFEEAHDALSGESSTHYTKLPTYPKTIQRINEASLQDTRFIYILRDPIDRLVSHYMHEWSQGNIHTDINKAVEQFPELIDYSRYFFQLEAFLKQMDSPKIMVLFFDSLKSNPQQSFSDVLNFIGYKGDARWDIDLKPQNVSSERIRKFPLYSALIDSTFLRSIRRACVPRSLREKIKKKLTLSQRPEINSTVLEHLHDVFNKELGSLNKLLGLDLDCENFKRETKNVSSKVINSL